MSTNRGDMPVSPTQGLDAQGLPLQEIDYGITIREQMAMAAMQGLIAAKPDLGYSEVSYQAKAHADALLFELERTK